MMKNVSKSRYTLFSDIRFLFADARQNADRVILYMVWTAVVGVALSLVELIAIPMIVKQIEDAAPLTTVLIVVLVLAAGLFVLRWLSRYLEGAFSESQDRFRTRGSTKLVRKALTVSYPRATEPRQLNVLNRAANAMGTHVHAPIPHMWKTFSNLLINTVGAVLCASLLLVWNPWPVLLTMITAAAGAIVHRFVNRWESRHHDEEATLDARLSYVPRIVESTELSGDIRVFGLAPWLKDVHDRSMRAMQAFFYRRAKIYLVATALDALLALLRNGIAYAVLMHLIITDALPISVFLLLFAAIGVFSQYVSGWFADLSTLCRERPELHIYRRYLEQEETFRFDGGKLPEHGRLHTIELRDVTFTYPGADKPTLSHIHLTLHEGEKLAVVGRDGVGKSALVHLLCGLYDPDEGAILLDGIDVRQLDRRAYYELFSVVFQESALPDMTVEENITQQSEAVDETRLWDCLEKAGIAAMVRDLPQGLDTHIGRTAFEDGVCLSGGQTQRLLLARALYKNGDILLLDEPTAALDPLAEHTLYQEYDRMTHGKSAVFISHRLASTRFCDRIIYLNNGTIAEEGTHEELLALDGEYARLFALQSRYYREGRDPDEDEIG